MSAVPSYRWLPDFYDELFQGYFAPTERTRKAVLGKILPHIESACDLACGTGTTAIALARRGIRVYGVDLSPEMCRVARRKAAKEKAPPRILHADMRSFELPEQVDLVSCEYDAINHVPRHSDLKLVLRAVSRALKPGGYFYFDVNNAEGFRSYWTGAFWLETPKHILAMRHGHNAAATKAWSDLDLFTAKGKLWERKRERVEEICWEGQEIRAKLSAAGFEGVKEWDGALFFPKNSPIHPGCRTVYLAQKSRA